LINAFWDAAPAALHFLCGNGVRVLLQGRAVAHLLANTAPSLSQHLLNLIPARREGAIRQSRMSAAAVRLSADNLGRAIKRQARFGKPIKDNKLLLMWVQKKPRSKLGKPQSINC
jgi:hypothetical protein